MKRVMIALIIAIPVASIIFGGVMLYFATHTDDDNVVLERAPLSKTSWKPSAAPARP